MRLEPTYEGLKLHTQPGRKCPPARLEPTYEGLKHEAQQLRDRSERSGLEPTYEGLKLPQHKTPPARAWVWSLPMRD